MRRGKPTPQEAAAAAQRAYEEAVRQAEERKAAEAKKAIEEREAAARVEQRRLEREQKRFQQEQRTAAEGMLPELSKKRLAELTQQLDYWKTSNPANRPTNLDDLRREKQQIEGILVGIPPLPIPAANVPEPLLEKIFTKNKYGSLHQTGNKDIDETIKHLDYLYGLPKGHHQEDKIKELESRHRQLAAQNPEIVASTNEWLGIPPKESSTAQNASVVMRMAEEAKEKQKRQNTVLARPSYYDYLQAKDALEGSGLHLHPDAVALYKKQISDYETLSPPQANSVHEQLNPFINIVPKIEPAKPAQLPPWMLPHHGMSAMLPQHQINQQEAPFNAYLQNMLGHKIHPAQYSPRASGSSWEKILSHFDPDLFESPF